MSTAWHAGLRQLCANLAIASCEAATVLFHLWELQDVTGSLLVGPPEDVKNGMRVVMMSRLVERISKP